MHPLRRLTAALSGALLLQLTLVGSGTLCGMKSGATVGARGHQAGHTAATMVHRMTMAEGPSVTAAHPSDGAPSPVECSASSASGGCQLPWSPASVPCASMMTCAAPAAPAATSIASMTIAPSALDLPDPERIRSAPPTAPELPPPRA